LKLVFSSFILSFLFVHCTLHAESAELNDFLLRASVKTFDCPVDEMVPQLERYLQDDNLPVKQQFRLKVLKSHWLICVGKFKQAVELLENVVNNPALDQSSHSHASANYQIGFILDVQENPQRCEYYRHAERLAKGRFDDIYLSAQLGQITVCDKESEGLGQKLGRLYALLEEFVVKGDEAAIAHIHNNIGLLYGSIGQNSLAAEQYEKSYLMGLNVYEEKNQIAPLISLISALMGSGDFNKALNMIEQLRKANLHVNTPLSNIWLHYAQARYAYQTGDYASLGNSLWKWDVFQTQVSNKQLAGLYRWYAAALCLYEQNEGCVRQYLADVVEKKSAYQTTMDNNQFYLRFIVQIHLFLGDIPAAQQSFEHFADVIVKKIQTQQASAKVLGVANLHAEVLALEANLAKAEQQRYQSMVIIALVILLLASLVYFTFVRTYLRRMATDPLTGLLIENAALQAIKQIGKPKQGKANAVAIFDVNNFTQVNSQFGHMVGELALKSVANCLKQVTREQDIVGRMGAGQFVVCLKNIEDAPAKAFFERIQSVLENTEFSSGIGEKINIDSSMSIYMSPDSFHDVDEVLFEIRDALIKAYKALPESAGTPFGY
jgi:diguanylate cyclase (GGDEF)-like protein